MLDTTRRSRNVPVLIQWLQSVSFDGFVLAFQVLVRTDLVSFYRFANLFTLKQRRAR